MGTYVTDQDVLSRLNEDFPPDTWRILIDDRISAREAEVESKLSDKYTVPITGTNSLRIVKGIVADLVAGDVLLTARQNETDQEFAERYPVGILINRAQSLLDLILNGDIPLNDAVGNTDESHTGTDGYDNLTDDEQDDSEPFFTRSQFDRKAF